MPKLTRSIAWSIAAAAAVALCGGCLINSSNEKVVQPDAKRVAVDFESEQALATFQKAVAARYAGDGGVVSRSGFAIPFVIGASEKRVLSENAFYNAQVVKADADGDGRLSEAEARVYAQ
jgi:hypothetical protein